MANITEFRLIISVGFLVATIAFSDEQQISPHVSPVAKVSNETPAENKTAPLENEELWKIHYNTESVEYGGSGSSYTDAFIASTVRKFVVKPNSRMPALPPENQKIIYAHTPIEGKNSYVLVYDLDWKENQKQKISRINISSSENCPTDIEVYFFDQIAEKEDWDGLFSFDQKSLDATKPVETKNSRSGETSFVWPENKTGRYVALRLKPSCKLKDFKVSKVDIDARKRQPFSQNLFSIIEGIDSLQQAAQRKLRGF